MPDKKNSAAMKAAAAAVRGPVPVLKPLAKKSKKGRK
jgi:hypothetical protein